jgi:hypothetical protein
MPERHLTNSAREILSPQVLALLDALANLGAGACDPWAKYPPVLGVEDVAEILGIEPPSVSEAARRGNLPMRKVLGKWRIDQLEFRRVCGATLTEARR